MRDGQHTRGAREGLVEPYVIEWLRRERERVQRRRPQEQPCVELPLPCGLPPAADEEPAPASGPVVIEL